jgi:hypothetical protein
MTPTFGSGPISDVLDTGTEQGPVNTRQRDEGSRSRLVAFTNGPTCAQSWRRGRRSHPRRSRGRHR